MSTDTARIKWVSDSAQMQADYDKLAAKVAKQDQMLARLKKSTRDVGDASSRMTGGAKQALDQATTAAEKYRQTMAALRAQVDAGTLSTEKYAKARLAAQATFKATDGASIAKAAAAAKKAADEQAAAAQRQAAAAKVVDAAQEEANNALRAGAAIFAKTRTEAEKYAAELAHLNELKKLGAIDDDTHSRAKAALDSNSPEAQERAAAAIKAKAEATRQADEAQEAWNSSVREAKAIADAHATAEERHAAELAKLNRLRQDGTLEEKHYARAVAAADERLKEATKDTKALAEAERAENKAKAEAEAITNRNKTAVERHAEGLKAAKKAYDSNRISLQTYNREVARLDAELGKTKGGLSSFLETAAKLGAVATAVKVVGAALAQEADVQRVRDRQAADEHVSYGEVLGRTINNFTADKTVGQDQLDERFAGIQERQKVRDRKAIARVAAEAFSAQGSLTNDQALQFVESGFKYAPDDEATANTFTTRSLDVAKATGVTDPKAIMGFLSQAQKAARVGDITALGKQGVQAMLGAQVHGATPEQSAELFSTLNSLMVDVEGANSKTAMLQLTSQLMDPTEIKKAGFSKQFEGKGLMERIEMLQADPQLADKFMQAKGISFEAAAKPFIGQFLRGDATAMKEYRAIQDAIPALDANAAKDFDKMIAERGEDPFVKLAATDRAREANQQAEDLTNRRQEAITGEADRIFQETIEKINLPGFDESPGMWIPGQREIMKRNVDINRNMKGKGGAGSVKATMEMMAEGGMFSELGGTLAQGDKDYLLKQLVEINKLQLEEAKLAREREKRQAPPSPPPPPPPAAPGQPLLNGGNPALAGAPQ